MHTEPIHLIGSGGHGRVVAEALRAAGLDTARIIARDGRSGLAMLGRPVVTPEVDEAMAGELFHVAIGSGDIRARLYAAARSLGAHPLTVIHPAAAVAPDAVIGAGVLIAAGAVVSTGAVIGDGTIVNHGAVVDHDVRVGAFCHVAPNATLGGGVALEDRVMIGSGAVILPGLAVAEGVTVGAGAVVLRSIAEQGTWAGSPARKLSS